MQTNTVQKKLFPKDKNYILKEAQYSLEPILLKWTIKCVRRSYVSFHNPLGLEDETIHTIQNRKSYTIRHLQEFYHDLAGIYRYKYGRDQLEIMFDGTPHLNKYIVDWKDCYMKWIRDFCTKPHFLRAVLEASLLYPGNRTAQLASNRLKIFLRNHFDLKVYKYRGIQELHAA